MGRYDLSPAELGGLLAGEPPYRARQVWDGLYRHLAEPAALTTLPRPLRDRLADDRQLAPSLSLAGAWTTDRGRTEKWLWRLADGAKVESVLMRYPRRATVCVSSQAGCAIGCPFCATGQAGLRRNLTVGEIVEQVARAMAACRDAGERPARPLSNVVFMGMGEPLANYDRVWEAVERICGDLGLSARHVTISTVGVVPGIRRLATERLPVGLAVSLHAANDQLRDRLVPLNRRYPLSELLAACRDYRRATRRRISFEWALIEGVNDAARDAEELAGVARPLSAHVNLIPLNRTRGYGGRGPSGDAVTRFAGWLEEAGLRVTVRDTRGSDIEAACGQLAG
ncbi:MAG: 23S rRNA (adenine(2503)-C(2))-methyltransferase RlmN [Acidimicrobiales bacterium]|nr:23S rRNA (adenine(2503)-C(2))-methyltransferase RlmN [Acidimicrobiales bacterium]